MKKHLVKTASEFGQTVTLHRIVNEKGQGTLWHADPAKALAAWERLAPIKGW